MDPLTAWAIALIVVALLLLFAELFIPSGGILSAMAALALAGGLVCLFIVDMTLGLVATLITMVALPFLIAFGIKIFPRTPVGRRAMLGESQQSNTITYDRNFSRSGEELIGQEGVAETDLRPIGSIRLDSGKRIEGFSEAGVILTGTRVKVSRIQGMEIKVRPLT